MPDKKRFYFFPFLDNLKAIGIGLLFMFIFGSWYNNAIFRTVFTMISLLFLGGFIYSRMWKLGKKNTQRKWGLEISDCVKFMLPLIIFEVAIIIFYFLCEKNIIPLRDIIIKSYYSFPENLPRELVKVSVFDYVIPVINLWFSYLTGVAATPLVYLIAPAFSLASAVFGFKMGSGGKELQDYYIKATDKVKDKFNE